MKKILLTCFLAPLCLFGSTSFLSLVAQSPGADSLPTSIGPHRGGDSRSDSFKKIIHGEEFSEIPIYSSNLSTVEGGPTLRSSDIRHRTALLPPISHLPALNKETASLRTSARSDDPLHWESVLSTVKASDIGHRTPDIKLNFGLVDSDQGNEEGKEASNFHSSSVPVFTEPVHSSQKSHSQSTEAQSLASCVLSLASKNGLVDPDQDNEEGRGVINFHSSSVPVLSGEINSSREASSQSTVAQSLASCVLCLASKKTSSFPVLPNQIKKELTWQNPSVTRFHIELPNTTAPDTLRLTYWDHFLKEHREVTPGTSIDLIADRGSFFEGNAGYKVYRWEMEGMEATRVFSIRMGSHHLIRYWNLPPGAQVKVRMELNSGVTYFWGPSSRFFKAQQEVDRLASEQSWQQSPLMVTNNPERMLSDSLISHYHQKSLSLPQELYLPMFFVVGGKSDRELLETYLSKPLEDYPLIRELAPLTEGMSETSKNLLVQRAYGETLRQLVSKLKLGRSWLKEEPFSTGFEAMLRELPIPTADQELDPVFLSAIYELVLLKGSIDRVPITRMLENYPATVSDRVLGLYLLDNFKRLEEHQNQYLADVLREVELPWVKELILDLKSRSLSGNTLMAPPLSDMEGKPFDLARLEGKAMVVSFWITGCRFCMRYYQNTLKEVYERWSDREEVVFVSVNADPNSQKWKESVATELYSHPKMIQLHQDAGSGILADFRISSFPQKLLITPHRKIFLLTLTQYSPDQLSEKIAQLLAQPEISQETKNTGF